MPLPMASLASTIAAALSKSNIKTVDEFARAVESAPVFFANLLRNEGIQEQAQHLHTEIGTATDTTTTQSVGTHAAVAADDMVDIATAEAMVNEALCMVAEAEAVAASLVNVAEVAERRASQQSLSAHFVTLKLSSIKPGNKMIARKLQVRGCRVARRGLAVAVESSRGACLRVGRACRVWREIA
jgi:hypothetical protein